MFTTRSRYASVADTTFQDANGRAVKYKVLRITPTTTSLQNHTVAQGDRLDLIAFQQFGDAEQFWRICDANEALRPDDLTQQIGILSVGNTRIRCSARLRRYRSASRSVPKFRKRSSTATSAASRSSTTTKAAGRPSRSRAWTSPCS